MTGRRINIFVCIFTSLIAMAGNQAYGAVVRAEISRLADTAHLEFKGAENWNYDLKQTGKNEIQLSVYPVDDASLAGIQSFRDALIQNIEVDRNGPDGTYLFKFKLTSEDVESFHYLTDDPSRLIIDFYKKSEEVAEKKSVAATSPKAAKKSQVASKKAAADALVSKNGYKAVPKVNRGPAGDEFLEVPKKPDEPDPKLKFGIFDGGDDNYDRFRIKDYEIREEAIIASKYNVYLPFPMLKMNASELDRILERRPEYVINPKSSKENKEARLLLTLFNRNRHAVYLKTYEYFVKKYPESQYLEILKNLTASVHLERWRKSGESADFERAQALYNELVQKFPESPLREHNYLILAFAQLERGDALSTLQTFEGFLKEYPKSQEVAQIRMGLAEAYLILRRFDEAKSVYEGIINEFPKTANAREARYRLGDVEFLRKNLSGAILAYASAIKDLPADTTVYPNAFFNMAEAKFWQKDYKESLEDYVKFVNLFPTNPNGGYALTRIGELLDILGADQTRVMGAFLESFFRFPKHPGALVARIRMVSRQMQGMKEKELKKGLDEIEKISSELHIEGMKEFTNLMVAEGLTGRGEYLEAIDRLITYFQKNPGSSNLNVIKSRVLRNISNQIKSLVDAGKFMGSLEYYSKYAGNWLKNTDRIDVPYFVGAAFENAGAYDESIRIYEQALKRRLAVVGTVEEKERKVQEHLPSVGSLHLRLAASAVAEREYLKAYGELKEIARNAELTPKEQIESVQLSATVFESRNDFDRARRALEQLAETWKGDPALVAPVHLRLAEAYLKLKDPAKAEGHANKALAADTKDSPVGPEVVKMALQVKGEALLNQGRSLAAVEAFQGLLERFESQFPLAQVRYQAGEILFNEGDLTGATKIWEKLKGHDGDLLWKIGQEKIEDARFRDDYEKYINRIPAMATRSGGKSK